MVEKSAINSIIEYNFLILQVLGRFIIGFAVSLSAVSDCVYISEIAPSVRMFCVFL